MELVPTTEDDPGTGQSRNAAESGADVVVACGGDGTVRACIEGIVDSSTALAIIPTGTGNLLATNLGIFEEVKADDSDGTDVVGHGVRRIDIGRVNGEAFAVMAGSGFDALMIRDANPAVKRRLGVGAYVLSAIRNLRSGMVGTSVVVDDAEWFQGRTVMTLVGNFGSITGGMEIFPDADPADGLLDVGVVGCQPSHRLGVHRLPTDPWPSAEPEPGATPSGRSIVIRTSSPRPYELDGEERPPTGVLHLSVEPSALTVRVGDDR